MDKATQTMMDNLHKKTGRILERWILGFTERQRGLYGWKVGIYWEGDKVGRYGL
jgi:hypothetical protein